MHDIGREEAYNKWFKVRQQFAETYQAWQPSAESSTSKYSDSASNDNKIRYSTSLFRPLDSVISQHKS